MKAVGRWQNPCPYLHRKLEPVVDFPRIIHITGGFAGTSALLTDIDIDSLWLRGGSSHNACCKTEGYGYFGENKKAHLDRTAYLAKLAVTRLEGTAARLLLSPLVWMRLRPNLILLARTCLLRRGSSDDLSRGKRLALVLHTRQIA